MRALPQAEDVLRRATDSGEVPGVVAMAATQEGPVFRAACGKRALPNGAAMSEDSVFWIASMTKAITSTAAMQLVEGGKLELDGPIGKLLPELASPQVLEGFDAAGAPRLRPAKRAITLRHLMTHTAGFGYDTWNRDLLRYRELKGIPRLISCENVALTMPLTFDPGDKWEYGINIEWVGKAVERVSGKPLGSYFEENIFKPLGMKDTAFRLGADQRARLVGMHARQAGGSLEPMPFEVPQEPEFQMGGGGLYGTAADYLAFQQAFLHEGRFNGARILKPETVRLMAQNATGDLKVRQLKSAMPAYSNDAEFFPGMVKKWGLGFMINTEEVPGGRSAGSLSWAGLGNTYFWIDQKQGVAGVILMQLLPFADPKALDLYGKYEKAIYASLGLARV
jgi:methyl acetate hydrolase